MRRSLTMLLASFCLGFTCTVSAYDLACDDDNDPCQAYKVYCDDDTYIGTIYWNGSNWSDGVRSGSSVDEVAGELVQAWGSSCT